MKKLKAKIIKQLDKYDTLACIELYSDGSGAVVRHGKGLMDWEDWHGFNEFLNGEI